MLTNYMGQPIGDLMESQIIKQRQMRGGKIIQRQNDYNSLVLRHTLASLNTNLDMINQTSTL